MLDFWPHESHNMHFLSPFPWLFFIYSAIFLITSILFILVFTPPTRQVWTLSRHAYTSFQTYVWTPSRIFCDDPPPSQLLKIRPPLFGMGSVIQFVRLHPFWLWVPSHLVRSITHHGSLWYEPLHEISNNVVCATSKASDQPAHTRSLIRAFASRLNVQRVLSYWLNIIWSFLAKRRLHMLVWVYTCQNTALLEITCHGPYFNLINQSHRKIKTMIKEEEVKTNRRTSKKRIQMLQTMQTRNQSRENLKDWHLKISGQNVENYCVTH